MQRNSLNSATCKFGAFFSNIAGKDDIVCQRKLHNVVRPTKLSRNNIHSYDDFYNSPKKEVIDVNC